MNLYNQIKYNGYRINIYYDDDARSPREAYDNLGTLYTAHRRYRPEKEFDDHFDIDKVFEGHIGNFRESFLKEYIALPVYLYDHGGITISTSPFSCRARATAIFVFPLAVGPTTHRTLGAIGRSFPGVTPA